ncbi:uncharacterized protein KGF55_000368 [Candida pseudojiufengensis]|uniref:uncharacterized protein n=1 Tax=Candida pseudojiufengensis TaxID=497109 RepID=UPI0022244E59|nr:uncharacterized protein KGF55_000368 [Candida pseudojiufengensis]KAI5966959.1 hypothetical protein KGF55_000368 [Candida pseudojiufengensis]
MIYSKILRGIIISYTKSISSNTNGTNRSSRSKKSTESQFESLHKNGVKIKVLGDEINSNPAIVLSNHSSLADFLVIQHLSRLSTKSDKDSIKESCQTELSLPVVNFFSWFLVWKVPNIKILFNLLKTDENWEIEEKSILYIFAKFLRSKFSEWIVLFPEVNIWSEDNYRLQQQVGQKYFLPKLNNVLYPRYPSFYNIITALTKFKPHPYTNLYDLTIIYCRPGKTSTDSYYLPPTLLEIFSSQEPITILVYIKLRSLGRIPHKRKKLERYLEHLWVHKDKIITQIKNENNNYIAAKNSATPNTTTTKTISHINIKNSSTSFLKLNNKKKQNSK